MNRLTSQQSCRLSGLSPLICVIIGAMLTVVGQIASIKICKIAGPVAIVLGGLLLAFITLCITRRQLQDLTEGTSCTHEQGVNTRQSEEGPNDPRFPELGPIHHFEIWIPPEHSNNETIVPPSYEESLQTNSVVTSDE